MHIHHRHLGAILAEVNVVSDEPRLVRFDEVDQLSDGWLQRVERSLANLRTCRHTGSDPTCASCDVLPGDTYQLRKGCYFRQYPTAGYELWAGSDREAEQ